MRPRTAPAGSWRSVLRRPQRGWPMLASPDLAKKIVDDVVTFSHPYGTAIDFRDGVGVVRLSSTPSDH